MLQNCTWLNLKKCTATRQKSSKCLKVKAGFERVGLSLPSTNFSPSVDKTWLKEVDVVDNKHIHCVR